MMPGFFVRQLVARGRGEAGYSLVEVLLAVLITAMLVGPLLAWMLLVMREQPIAQDGMIRTAQAGILRGYFPQDVANAGAADDYADTPSDPRWDATWRTECAGGGGQDGRPLAVLINQGPAELVKTIYSVAEAQDDATPVDGSAALWRDECVADSGVLIRTTQIVENVVDDPDRTRASCSSSNLANGQPDAPCRQVRMQVATVASGSETVELSATRRADARSLDVGPAGNLLPVARITVESSMLENDGTPALRVRLTAADSFDPDGEVLTYRWELPTGPEGSGAAVDVVENGAAVQERVLQKVGTYWVRLTVTDEQGATNSTYRRIDVENRKPVAVLDVSPAIAIAGQSTIEMSALASFDPDGPIQSFRWRLSSALAAAEGLELILDGPSATWEVPEWVFGRLIVELTVEDEFGESDTVATQVDVEDPEPPPGNADPEPEPEPEPDPDPVPGAPVASFVATVGANRQVNFDAAGSTGSITSFAWQFGLLAGNGTGQNVLHTYPAPGTYTAVLTVTDDEGRVSTRSQLVVVPGDPAAPLNVRVVGRDLAWDPRVGARRYLVDLESVGSGCARSILNQAVPASAQPRKALPPNPCTGSSTVRARVGTEATAGGTVAWSAWIDVPTEVVK